MNAPLPPPGWYPDTADSGLLRWWDGTQWTSVLKPKEPLPPGPESPQSFGQGSAGGPPLTEATSPDRKAVSFRTWVWVAGTLVVLVVAVALLGLLAPKEQKASNPAQVARPEPAHSTLTGFGATLADWEKKHTRAANYQYPCCWGVPVDDGNGSTVPTWGSMFFTGDGRMYDATRSFPKGTTEASAMRALRRDDFPKDARLVGTVKQPNCLNLFYRSHALDLAYPSPVQTMTITMYSSYVDRPYTPRKVVDAILMIGKNGAAEGGC